MNERFFLLPLEKQNKIINAAFKVFAQNDYKKAPMSEIASEGGISKALLFHYFTNKKELFLFLWDKTINLTVQSIEEYKVMETTDFFEMLTRSTKAKCSLMRHYLFLYLFSMNAYYTECPEIKEEIVQSFNHLSQQSLTKVIERIDDSGLRKELKMADVYREILLASDGFMLQRYRTHTLDIDDIENQYMHLIEFWKQAYT